MPPIISQNMNFPISAKENEYAESEYPEKCLTT